MSESSDLLAVAGADLSDLLNTNVSIKKVMMEGHVVVTAIVTVTIITHTITSVKATLINDHPYHGEFPTW